MKAVAALFGLTALASAAGAEVSLTNGPAGEVLVDVSVEGHGPTPFVFASAAAQSSVSLDLADSWRLPRARAADGSAVVGPARMLLPPATLDRVTVEGIEAVVLPPRTSEATPRGTIGADLFGDRIVDFDLPRRRLALLNNARALTAGRVALAGRRTTGGVLAVPAFVGTVAVTIVIDTTTAQTTGNAAFARDVAPSADTPGVVPEVKLGSLTLAQPPVRIAETPAFEAFGINTGPALIVGRDWLARTRVVMDFLRDRVWFLEPESAQ